MVAAHPARVSGKVGTATRGLMLSSPFLSTMHRGRSLDTPDATAPVPSLPSLGPGVTLLDVAGDDATRREQVWAFQSLVVDHMLLDPGPVLWVDARGFVTTRPMTTLAPSERFLDRIRAARGFTAVQHFSITASLVDRCPADASLVVAPALDARYRDEDAPPEEAQSLFLRTLARLTTLARETDVPVLVTRTGDDGLGAPVAEAASRRLTCEHTRLGPRFAGADFETLVYPAEDGLVQTTLAYWQRVIAARKPVYEADAPAATQPEVARLGPN